MALLKCLEPVTAIGCGLGALALGALDGGLTAGAMIGGAALMRAFGEARSTHGLESDKHIARTRLAILRAFALDDLDEATRDSIGLADTALAAHLGEAMPSREALGAAAVNRDRYPAAACTLILERLEQHDPLFRDDHIARNFAARVIEAALEEGLNNPDYIQLLSVHILTAVAQGVAEIKDDTAEILAWVRAQKAGASLSDQALRGAIARFIAFQPEASDADMLSAVETFERDYRALLELVSHIRVHDNYIQSLKNAAEEALEAGDIATARTRYADAAKAATDKASEPVRNAAALKSAEASAALTMLDWYAADKVWEQAAAMLMPFDIEAGEDIVWEAGTRLKKFGETFAHPPALVASERHWRELEVVARQRGDAERAATVQVRLGSALLVQGERTGGDAGLALLQEAIAAFRAALTVQTQTAMPADWAITQNYLGSVLNMLGERTRGQAGHELTADAASAYHAVLSVCTRETMPAEWAMTLHNLGNILQSQAVDKEGDAAIAIFAQAVRLYRDALTVRTLMADPVGWAVTQNNLGNALQMQGFHSKGRAGLQLLTEASAAYREALTVHTEAAMPVNWAMTLNGLGNALLYMGSLTEDAAGLALLAEAVIAHRDALRVRTLTAMPTKWAMTQNNIGIVLQAQGARTEGEAGLALLSEGVQAYRAALTVRTQEAMPVDWAITQNSLGIILQMQGERTRGGAGLTLLGEALIAYRAALSVLTREHFSHYHEMASNNLAQTEAAIAARRR